jgi:hypothetical protein
LLPVGEVRARLSVAVPPASAEPDESARDAVCPCDTDVESRRTKRDRATGFDPWPREFITG